MKIKLGKKRKIIWSVVLLGLLFTGIAVIIVSELKMSKLILGGLGESFSTRVYSAPTVLHNHSEFSRQNLIARMERLNYKPSNEKTLLPGQYRIQTTDLYVCLRGFETPHFSQPSGLYLLQRVNSEWVISDADGVEIDQIAVEPEMAAELSGPQKVRREPATFEEIPASFVDAVVAIEDRRFFKHHGIDVRAIARAMWFNVRNTGKLQGGSTITQQLAKNFFLTHDRTLRRKAMEAFFAVYLDLRYPKEKILTLYLNQIYFGQDGFVSVAGVKSAAHYYFRKPLSQLDLSESATLAGLIRSPLRYNPIQHPVEARQRRDVVLNVMNEEGMIDDRTLEKTRALPVSKVVYETPKAGGKESDYYVAEVIRQLLPQFSEDMLFRYGLRIHTAMDPLLQKFAQETIKNSSTQGALIAIDPATGKILALAGGKDFRVSQFNRATQALRQVGSAFKPFVFGAALENGFTPASMLKDEPRAYTNGDKVWVPKNFGKVYNGDVSVRQALALSLNLATLDLAQKTGLPRIKQYAERMGIRSALEDNLTMALGASALSPQELTFGYAPFANGGFRVNPILVTDVIDSSNQLLQQSQVERLSVLEPAQSYMMTSLLQSVMTDGTATGVKAMGWVIPSAGKTGTTNEGKDAWFIGYTSDLLVGVWTGNDESKPLGLSGSKNALPLWVSFMKKAYPDYVPAPFHEPLGLMKKKIDPLSGLLARSGCPQKKEEVFIAGTEPQQACPLHAGGIRGWLQKLFR